MIDHAAEGSLGREVAICLVYDDDAVEQAQHFYDGFTVDVVARRIVRTTEPDNLGIVIAGIDNLIGCHLIVLIKQHLPILHVIDIGTYLIHAIGWSNGYNIVLTRATEHTVNQIDGLVGTVAQEDFLFRHTLYLTDLLLQLHLKRVWIAIVRVVIWILVGIEEYAGISAGEFCSSATVWCQVPDVLPAQVF